MKQRYRKKPVEVEAVQWNGDNYEEVSYLIRAYPYMDRESKDILIPTLEGVMRARIGSFIIKGIKGECYPCQEDIFYETYEIIPS